MLGVLGMDVHKILKNGYFDAIKVTGALRPIYGSDGIDITYGETFINSANNSKEAFKNGLAQLRIYMIGESNDKGSSDVVRDMQEDRERSGIKCIEKSNNRSRYIIAHVDLIIVKCNNAIPLGIDENGKDEGSFHKLAKANDILELLLATIDLREHIKSKSDYTDDYISIVIVDKVYVQPPFRRSGISEWIHENMADMVNMFSLVWPAGILLAYGDFCNEAKSMFNMSSNKYNNMLLNHYKRLGYESVRKIALNKNTLSSNILYKTLV